jgi:hypothetical protein
MKKFLFYLTFLFMGFSINAQVTVVSYVPENGTVWTNYNTGSNAYITFSASIIDSSLEGITINGNPFTPSVSIFSPQILSIFYAFEWSTSYEIFIPAAAIDGLEDDIVFTFSTPPALAPSSFLPAENATGVELDAAVEITFNKDINTNTWNPPAITIAKTGGDNVGGVSFVAVTWQNPGNKLIINHNDFDYDSEYTVTVPVGVVNSYNEVITWQFTTMAEPSQYVTEYDPAKGSEWNPFYGPDNHPYAQLTFKNSITGSTLQGITVNDNAPINVEINTYNNKQLRIYYTYNWGSSFQILIPATAILDYPGVDIVYNFTTPPALAISTYAPVENATNVAVNAPTVVTFNKNIMTNPVVTPVVTITKTGGGTVGGVSYVPVLFSNPSNKLVINHDSFEYESEYTVNVPAYTVNDWTEPITWTFTTMALTVTGYNPTNGGVWNSFSGPPYSNNVSITFSGTIEGSTLQGITVNGNDPQQAVLSDYNKAQLLIYYAYDWDTDYEIFVPATAIKDYNGEDIVYTFSTPPAFAISSYSPAENSTDAEIDAEVFIEFNKNINTIAMGEPTIVIGKTGGGNVTNVSYIKVSPMSPPSNKFIITHDDFEYGAEYTVYVSAGAVLNWNEIITWKFSTKTLLAVSEFNPENQSEWEPFFGPDEHPFAQITFNKTIEGSSLEGITVNGNTPQKVELNENDKTQLRIYEYFDWGTDFEIFVPADAITDYLGEDIVYTFSTPDKPTYTISALVSGYGGNISPKGQITVILGENQTFTFEPFDDYEISKILVDGENVPSAVQTGSYTFENVIKNHTIVAYFDFIQGINDISKYNIHIFSSNKVVAIINKDLVSVKHVEIIDIYGRIVWQGQAPGAQTNITLNVAAGIYAVRIITGNNQQLTTKIFISN